MICELVRVGSVWIGNGGETEDLQLSGAEKTPPGARRELRRSLMPACLLS